MTDHDIEKMIRCTIDNMPIPWEKLWTIFQKIIQLTYKKIATVTGKTSYTDKKSLKSKKTYYYKVVSIRKSGSKVLTAKSSVAKKVKIK